MLLTSQVLSIKYSKFIIQIETQVYVGCLPQLILRASALSLVHLRWLDALVSITLLTVLTIYRSFRSDHIDIVL